MYQKKQRQHDTSFTATSKETEDKKRLLQIEDAMRFQNVNFVYIAPAHSYTC